MYRNKVLIRDLKTENNDTLKFVELMTNMHLFCSHAFLLLAVV